MTRARRDQNFVPTIIGVSSVDLKTPQPVAVNPTTGAVIIDPTNLDSRYVNVTGDTMMGNLTFERDGSNNLLIDLENKSGEFEIAATGSDLRITRGAVGWLLHTQTSPSVDAWFEINQRLIPDADGNQKIGDSVRAFEEGWFDKLFLNSTATLDGATAGEVNLTGDLVFTDGSGLAFGEIYTVAAGDELTIGGTGVANKVQITSFTVDGLSNNMTPDHTNDHITVTKAGMYLCTVSLHVESAGAGGADVFAFTVYKNDGQTAFANVHAHRQLAGGGGDVGSVSLSGIIDLAEDDTIELWAWNEDSTDNLVVQDVTMALTMIGGT